MDNEKFVKWCETATADIRYQPDRKMVANELVGHLEDRRDALMAEGLDERTATDQALESMGDAKEIAPQLGALHKPFWGYFECATRYIAYILCVALLFVGTFLLSSQSFDSLFDKKQIPTTTLTCTIPIRTWNAPWIFPQMRPEALTATPSPQIGWQCGNGPSIQMQAAFCA